MRSTARWHRPLEHSALSPRLALSLVAIVSTIVYWRAASNGYAMDDAVILGNPVLHDPRALARTLASPWWHDTNRLYRPLTLFTFGLDHLVAPGRSWSLHTVNVVLHALVAACATRFYQRVLPAGAALAAGLLFALLPVHAEAVASVVGRAELLAGLMTVLLLLLVTGGRAPAGRARAVAALLAAGALAAKEVGVVAPLVALAGAWTVPHQRSHAARWMLAALCGTAILLAARLAVLGTLAGDLANPAFRAVSVAERVVIALTMLPRTAAMLVLPVPPAIDFVPTLDAVRHPAPLALLLGVALVAAGVVAIARHRSRPSPASLGACIAVAAAAPTANLLFASGVVLSGRTLYVPSLGSALLAGAVLAWLARSRARGMAPVVAGTMLLAAGAVTWREVPVWRDSASVIATMRARQPGDYRTHYHLGYRARDAGRLEESRAHFAAAVQRFPADAEMLTDGATVALRLRDSSTARRWLELAVEVEPRAARARTRLFGVMRASGDSLGADRLLEAGLAILPEQREWRRLLAREVRPDR